MFGLVVIELELAITFSQRALASKDEETAQRNAGLAYQAYGVATKFIRRNQNLSQDMVSEIQARIAVLHEQFRSARAGWGLETCG